MPDGVNEVGIFYNKCYNLIKYQNTLVLYST
jgi:hypothetical protein